MEHVLVWAGAIVLLGAAATVLVRLGLLANRVVVRIKNFLDDWAGESARPGLPRRPGVTERLAAIEGRLSMVEKQLEPNDGQTLRDAVDRVETAVTAG